MNLISFKTLTRTTNERSAGAQLRSFFVLFLACLTTQIQAQSNETIRFPADAQVWNVKDYGATGNGSTDDTQAIQDAIVAALSHNNRYDAVRIIYLPNGTYKISNTLVAKNLNALNWSKGWRAGFFMQGESHNGTKIKLATNALGFWDPSNPKPMIKTGSERGSTGDAGSCCDDGRGNEAFRHYIRNMTIDVGQGNAGAVGIDFLVSNRGGIYDVTIKSSDNSGKRGFAGILMDRGWPGPGVIKNVTIDGFEYGMTMRNNHQQYGMVLENITLKNQRTYGMWIQRNSITARNLTSNNSVTAVFSESGYGHITIIDGQFSGGSGSNPAIKTKAATYLRNVTTSGYGQAVDDLGVNNRDRASGTLNEYKNLGTFKKYPDAISSAIKLPIKETPTYHTNDFSKWVKVDGSGSDDLAAIQGAIDSGKEIVYLPVGEYRVSNTIVLRGNVKKMIGLCAGIKRTSSFPSGEPILRFDGGTQPDVIIQFIRLFGNLELNSSQNLVIQNAGVTKKVYNTANATGEFYIEDAIIEKVHLTHPQDSWIRQLNCEFAGEEYFINNGGKAWMFGYKTEGKSGSLILNKGGGWLEMWGGFFYANNGVPNVPAIVNEDSYLTANYKIKPGDNYAVHVKDVRNGTVREFLSSEASYTINMDLYSSAPISHQEHRGIVALRNKESGNYLRYKDGQFSVVTLTSAQLSAWDTHKFQIVDLNNGDEALKHDQTGDYLWYKDGSISLATLTASALQSWTSQKLEFQVQSDGYYWIKHQSSGEYLYDKLNAGVQFQGIPQTSWNGPKWEIVSITPNTAARISQATGEEVEDTVLETVYEGINIYPVPSSGVVTIDVGSELEAEVAIFDMNGRLIFSQPNVSGGLEVELPTGVFIAQIQLNTGDQVTKKLVIR